MRLMKDEQEYIPFECVSSDKIPIIVFDPHYRRRRRRRRSIQELSAGRPRLSLGKDERPN